MTIETPEGDRAGTGVPEADFSAALAALTGDRPPTSIPEVVARLATIRDYATDHSPLGENDGIASFSRLYHVITARIGSMAEAGEFRSPEFLVRLDVEFAERYFRAIRRYAHDREATPGVWRVLFDNRTDADIPALNFAVTGVNAHINYDLALALVMTWRHIAPDGDGEDSAQFHDYRLVNEVFEMEMDDLREGLHSMLSIGPDGAPWDRGANFIADLVVRFTRDLAWNEAEKVWRHGGTDEAVAASENRLDPIATFIGERLLHIPLPV